MENYYSIEKLIEEKKQQLHQVNLHGWKSGSLPKEKRKFPSLNFWKKDSAPTDCCPSCC